MKYWREYHGKVVERGSHYETTSGETLYWEGREAVEAQRALSRRAKEKSKGYYSGFLD